MSYLWVLSLLLLLLFTIGSAVLSPLLLTNHTYGSMFIILSN
jgi:hypothetical protein